MLHGIIKVPVTDLRAAPDSKAERLSQALFGTPVEIGEIQKEFTHIILLDKYAGWCRTAHIHQVSFALWQKYVAEPRHRVKTEAVLIRSGPSKAAYPFRLFFGTELVIRPHNGEVHFELPASDIRAPISTRCLIKVEKKRRSGPEGKQIVATAARFVGVPYLWGGITPLGFDCSGLVQAVYRFHGIDLPRDSKDQRNEGFIIDRQDLQPGDLLFFPGHVAMSCSGKNIVHASASRGMVTVDSLDPSAQNYREDLDREFIEARRLSL